MPSRRVGGAVVLKRGDGVGRPRSGTAFSTCRPHSSEQGRFSELPCRAARAHRKPSTASRESRQAHNRRACHASRCTTSAADLGSPALLEGLKLTKKAAKVGFDWENADQIFDKLNEETAELRSAIKNGDKTNIDEEIGDLLFVVMNLARHLDVEVEDAAGLAVVLVLAPSFNALSTRS